MTRFSVLGIFILALSSSLSAYVLGPQDVEGCGGSVFVEDMVVIDAPLGEKCKWQIKTDEGHILVFTVVDDGNFKQVQEFLTIHDGLDVNSNALLFENQKIYGVSNKNLPEAVYTTGSVAEIRFKKTPISVLKLRIQKAVDCPINLGEGSQCGRIMDETSCYCVTFTGRNHGSQTSYCTSYGMKLLAVEYYSEEVAIQNTWGSTSYFWTSGTDQSEGHWIWESTGLDLTSGYTNWADGEPNNKGEEDCLILNWTTWNGKKGWADHTCGNSQAAICEAHP